MHPYIHAQNHPDRAACIMAASGEVVTYRELDARSNQGAHLFRSLGLEVGDVVAVFMENTARYFDVAWAANRSGLYLTCISSKLSTSEVEYIVKDCGAKVLVAGASLRPVLDELKDRLPGVRILVIGDTGGAYESYDAAVEGLPTTPIAGETTGADMLYSSGTTGRPKGVKGPLSGQPIEAPTPW
ncbi:AMP-binding protein [Oleomonas cavernae]|uniref:AMP-binding protein n=1 Tax=Oleomonas cavernae TaxID=2320859 RepID=UPI0018F3200B|nr:AMP-binding protein [Oleomonas cavernae]